MDPYIRQAEPVCYMCLKRQGAIFYVLRFLAHIHMLGNGAGHHFTDYCIFSVVFYFAYDMREILMRQVG